MARIKTLYDKRKSDIRSGIIFNVVFMVVLTVLAAFVFINNFVLFRVDVSGSSMQPTLMSGDRIVASYYGKVERTSIIIIKDEKPYLLIKRAIAFGGETVKISGGYVFLKEAGETEFKKLDETYLADGVRTFYPNIGDPGNTAEYIFKVGEGEVFFLGDNRTVSADSRSEFGTCREEQIVGVVSDFALSFKGVTLFFDGIAENIRNLFVVKK